MAEKLVATLSGLVGDDTWEDFRHKVRAFVPDGAHDEQLIGQLISDAFPEMRCVLRCGVHTGAMKTAWLADDTAK